MTVPTNVTQTAGLQTLNDDAGRPLFVVLPVAEYLRLKQRNEPTIPHEVVNLRFEGKGMSAARAWREYLGLTQVAVAERMGITQAALAQMEAAKRPRKITRDRIAKALSLVTTQLDF